MPFGSKRKKSLSLYPNVVYDIGGLQFEQ